MGMLRLEDLILNPEGISQVLAGSLHLDSGSFDRERFLSYLQKNQIGSEWGKWRGVLSDDELKIIDHNCREQLLAFQY